MKIFTLLKEYLLVERSVKTNTVQCTLCAR
jgi:hypothetical protein